MKNWLIKYWFKSVLEGSADSILNSEKLAEYLNENPELNFVLLALLDFAE